jgi:hypothetical protein
MHVCRLPSHALAEISKGLAGRNAKADAAETELGYFLRSSERHVSFRLFGGTDLSDCVPGLLEREPSHTRQATRMAEAGLRLPLAF